MASASSPTPQKKLAEFLKEPQEPFVLQVYLLERRYSRKWSTPQDQEGGRGHSYGESSKRLQRSASSPASSKKRKALLPFTKVLTSVCKKLASHNKDEDIISVPQTDGVDQNQNQNQHNHQIIGETDRFSSASSSTVFNSCSEIDEIEEETWTSSHKDQPSFVSDTGQASNVHNIAAESGLTNNGKNRGRYLEDSLAFLGKVPSCSVQVSQNNERVKEEVWRMEQSIPNSEGFVMPKKITEDSLLSAALWGFLIQTNKTDNYSMTESREILGTDVSQALNSKRALHKTKQLLFDCVREITVNFPRMDEEQIGYRQLLEAEELGNLICHRIKEWGQQAGHQTNLTCLLTLDQLNSVNEWSDLEPHMKDISFEIAEAILERITNEILSEMVGIFTPNI